MKKSSLRVLLVFAFFAPVGSGTWAEETASPSVSAYQGQAMAQTPAEGGGVQKGFVIGLSTERLLALQRTSAPSRPRTIDADQASRSYERYLKSFEYPIPEKYETGTETKK